MRNRNTSTNRERVLYTLPSGVVKSIDKYARKIRKGNKSGFVADAIEAYISLLQRKVETNRIRASYIDSAEDSMKASQEWQVADAELEEALNEIESKK